jgi:hypothetical protein
MPKWTIHFALSRKRTDGDSYEKLHKWIDENSEEEGVNHRNNGRHVYTNENRKYVYFTFGGDEAVSEWLFHIALDNLDTSVNNDWNHLKVDNNFHKFGFKDNGFVYYDEAELEEEEMEEEFPEN